MTDTSPSQETSSVNRREFLRRTAAASAIGAVGLGGGGYWLSRRKRPSRALGKKVIVVGVDGMDPRLARSMMDEGLLPNLSKLRTSGGFSDLGTSIPPQSPVAWASFINGAGPGSHGIFDFVHRHPEKQCEMFYSAADTMAGEGFWETGDYKLQLDFWPFNHRPPETKLMRKGVPFWDYLDAAGIPSTFYDLPSNYPPSPSHHGHHRCISGMGTTDLLGSYGKYQYFSEDGPEETYDAGGGLQSAIVFNNETADVRLVGPENSLLKSPEPVHVDMKVHRDRGANAAVIEVQGRKLLLKPGDMSAWVKLNFTLATPWFVPDQGVPGICRFFLQEVTPNFRLYVSPINIDPSAPVVKMSEPETFIQDVSAKLGLFYTTGFQEDYSARKDAIFNDDDFARQAGLVLEERLALFDYAVDDYEDGMLFFYFSSSDLQSHIFWWDSDDPHPMRSADEAKKYFSHVRKLYQRLDQVVGELIDRYASRATLILMSDHGFANFSRQFNINSWLRAVGYLGPPECTSLFADVNWAQTAAYGLGLNGLYLNLKGRERDGIIEPGAQQEALLRELVAGLEQVRDFDGSTVIRKVYRASEVYQGGETRFAPDLIVGYARGYRASWDAVLGNLSDDVLLDNNSAWSADHCADAQEVPGILFTNRAIAHPSPALVDIAPSILSEFGLTTPAMMTGKSIFS